MIGSASLPFLEDRMSSELDEEAYLCFLALEVYGLGAMGFFKEGMGYK